MKKRVIIISIIVILITLILISTIPFRLRYNQVKKNLIINTENNTINICFKHNLYEINYMASQNGHVYLYSLEDGSRCYAQYLYVKSSLFDFLSDEGSMIYKYPLSNHGAEHGIAYNILESGEVEEIPCYTVEIYYQDPDGSNYKIWSAGDEYNRG